MKNNINTSIDRMKELIGFAGDNEMRQNVSETIEKKVKADDGKYYGIVREKMKYYIKESADGQTFDYIGGFPNKSENEYPSYNSASRNLELTIRMVNEKLNNNKVFNLMNENTQSEYIVEATQEMRDEINRQKKIMSEASNIMDESEINFNKDLKFKEPVLKEDDETSENDEDSADNNDDGGEEQLDESNDTKNEETKEDVVSETTNKPKKLKITEEQYKQIQKILKEDMFDYEGDEVDDFDDSYGDEYVDDEPEETETLSFSIPSRVTFVGEEVPQFTTDNPKKVNPMDTTKPLEYVGDGGYKKKGFSYVIDAKDDEYILPTSDLVKYKPSQEEMSEGILDNIKSGFNAVKDAGKSFGGDIKKSVDNAKQNIQQNYNKNQQSVVQGKIDDLAQLLKNEFLKLNDRTVKGGGEPLNYNSLLMSLSNRLRGDLRRSSLAEEDEQAVDNIDEAVKKEAINKLTESIIAELKKKR